MNPRAQYQSKITIEGVINSVKVADPLNILDCSPITDGAAAVVVVPADRVKGFKKPGVKIIGTGHATDAIALYQREDLTTLAAVNASAEQAYKMAGKEPKDIDFAEVHDCFSIAEIIVSESIGFFERGKGGPAAEAGETGLEGKRPINPSGGLKSKGHPVGATGIAQIVEITEQLRGEAGKRQLKNARVGLAQNMGGSGGSSVVHILEAM
jgi:acetyl-CoA C-acetyltransferase